MRKNPVETSSPKLSITTNPMEEASLDQSRREDGERNGNTNPSNNQSHPPTADTNEHNSTNMNGGGGGHNVNQTAPSSPVGTESPGTSQMSPPPSYNEIPGTVRPLNRDVPPPSYEDAVDPNVDPPSYDSLFGRILDTHKASRNLADFLLRLILLLIGTLGCTVACSVTVVIPVAMVAVGATHIGDCPAEPYIPIFLIVGGAFLIAKYLIGVATRVRRGHRQIQRLQQQQQQQQSQSDRDTGGGGGGGSDPVRGATVVHVFREPRDENVREGGGGRASENRRSAANDAAEDGEEEESHPVQAIISCFLCAWFITGCVWVYRIYEPVMDPLRSHDPDYCHAAVYGFAFWTITAAYILLGLVTSCICCISIYAQTRTERQQ